MILTCSSILIPFTEASATDKTVVILVLHINQENTCVTPSMILELQSAEMLLFNRYYLILSSLEKSEICCQVLITLWA